VSNLSLLLVLRNDFVNVELVSHFREQFLLLVDISVPWFSDLDLLGWPNITFHLGKSTFLLLDSELLRLL